MRREPLHDKAEARVTYNKPVSQEGDTQHVRASYSLQRKGTEMHDWAEIRWNFQKFAVALFVIASPYLWKESC